MYVEGARSISAGRIGGIGQLSYRKEQYTMLYLTGRSIIISIQKIGEQ